MKSKHNNYIITVGKLGDILMLVYLAKLLNQIDGSITKIIVMKNSTFLKDLESDHSYVKILPVSIWSILFSFYL